VRLGYDLVLRRVQLLLELERRLEISDRIRVSAMRGAMLGCCSENERQREADEPLVLEGDLGDQVVRVG
jgi:hypothetical protein